MTTRAERRRHDRDRRKQLEREELSVAVTWAVVRDRRIRADVESAKQQSHDLVIEQTGSRRRSGVRWSLIDSEAIAPGL